jgi:ribosomal protein S21
MRNKYDIQEEGARILADAIILQAALDYRAALERYKRSLEALEDLQKMKKLEFPPKIIEERIKDAQARVNGAKAEAEALERFFFSKWGQTLAGNINGAYIVRKLRKECGINGI